MNSHPWMALNLVFTQFRTNELLHLQLKSTKKNQNLKRLMVPFILCSIIRLSCQNNLGTYFSQVWKKSFCLNLKIGLYAQVYVMYDTCTHIFARVFNFSILGMKKMKMLVSLKSRQIVGNGPSFCRKLPSGAMAIPIWADINLEQHKRGHEMCNFNWTCSKAFSKCAQIRIWCQLSDLSCWSLPVWSWN